MTATAMDNGVKGHGAERVGAPQGADTRRESGGPAAGGNGSGRDAQGRFRTGNRGGPGNPFARRVAALRQAMYQAVREEDVQAITEALVEKAKAGEVAAAKLVLSYVIGKPPEAVDPDRLDLEEWQLYQEGAVSCQEVDGLLKTLQPFLACGLARELIPIVPQELARQVLAKGGMPEGAAAGAGCEGAKEGKSRAGAGGRQQTAATVGNTAGSRPQTGGMAAVAPSTNGGAAADREAGADHRKTGPVMGHAESSVSGEKAGEEGSSLAGAGGRRGSGDGYGDATPTG